MRWKLPGLIVAVLTLLTANAGSAAAEAQLPSPSTWPLPGTPRVIEGFDPPAQRWGSGHRGVDLAADVGDAVRAAAGGTVSFAADLAGRGVVVIDHGEVRTTYEPVAAGVDVGDRVGAGQVIGTLQGGSHCAEPCLHWGLRQGDDYLDPLLLATAVRVRLLPAAEREAARRRVVEREVNSVLATARGLEADATAALAGSLSGGGLHGFGRPVAGAVTSGFGMRFHPVLKLWKLHDGTDFGAACGSLIRAPYSGTVRQAYFNPGYGNRLMIDHGRIDGRTITTGYNHAISYSVRPGQGVQQGQVIGRVGTTGYSTGCHLHLMVWLDGQLTDPMTWF